MSAEQSSRSIPLLDGVSIGPRKLPPLQIDSSPQVLINQPYPHPLDNKQEDAIKTIKTDQTNVPVIGALENTSAREYLVSIPTDTNTIQRQTDNTFSEVDKNTTGPNIGFRDIIVQTPIPGLFHPIPGPVKIAEPLPETTQKSIFSDKGHYSNEGKPYKVKEHQQRKPSMKEKETPNTISAPPILASSVINEDDIKPKLPSTRWFKSNWSRRVAPIEDIDKSVTVPVSSDDEGDTNQKLNNLQKPLLEKARRENLNNLLLKPFYGLYDFLAGPLFHAPGYVFSLQELDKAMFVHEVPGSHIFPFHPHSLFLQVWNTIAKTSIILFCILLPVCLSVPQSQSWLRPLYQFFVLISILQIGIQSNTGYIQHRVLEMSPGTVRYQYFSSLYFFSDAYIAIPWVYIADRIYDGADSSVQLSNTPGRLLCLLSMYSFISVFLWNSENRVCFMSDRIAMFNRMYNIKSAFVSMFVIVISMAFYWHWVACATLYLAYTGVEKKLMEIEHTAFNLYSHCFFHAVSEMMSAGWAVPSPTFADNTLYIWLRIINIIISASFLAVFVGNISSVMIGLDSSGRQFQEKIEEVSQYSRYKGFDDEIRNRLLEYFEFKYNGGKYFDEQKILNELNHPLRQLIAIHDCESLIVKVPFFATADPLFISQVVVILRPIHFLPGDTIIEEGTDGDEMFFISTGTVEVMVAGDLIATLVDGQFFGEIAVIMGRCKRTATVKAVSKCVLYMLSQSQLSVVLEDHPEMAEKFKNIARQRIDANARSARGSFAISNSNGMSRHGSEKKQGDISHSISTKPRQASLDSGGRQPLIPSPYLGVESRSRAGSHLGDRNSVASGSNIFLHANDNSKRPSTASRYSRTGASGGGSHGDNWTRIILLLQANQLLHDQGQHEHNPDEISGGASSPLARQASTARTSALLSLLGPKINQIPVSTDPGNERGWGKIREIVRSRRIFDAAMECIDEDDVDNNESNQ